MTHKQVIVLRKDLKMRRGKECAQGAHASMAAILNLAKKNSTKLELELDDRTEPWINGNFKKICCYVNSEEELVSLYKKAQELGVISSLIIDSGLTEFNGVSTKTAVAIGPDYNEVVDQITKHLPLM